MQTKYYASEEMYAFDHFTIHKVGVPSPVLMERAAFSMVDDLRAKIPLASNILVVAGTGNNGGDAVAVARMLFLGGYDVELLVLSKENYSEGMALQMTIAQNIGLVISFELVEEKFAQADYIIEGIFGIGLDREISGCYQAAIEAINDARVKYASWIISVDIPSGLSAKTGVAFKPSVQADATYTFGFYKKGMDQPAGKALCGSITLCDIGYPLKLLAEVYEKL